MAEKTGQEKTHPASPRKRQKAREEGQVAKSREINSVMLLGGALGFFVLFGGSWMQTWTQTMQKGLDVFSIFEMDLGWSELGRHWTKTALILLTPFMILFPLMAIAAGVPQVGFHITTKVLLPKADRKSVV